MKIINSLLLIALLGSVAICQVSQVAIKLSPSGEKVMVSSLDLAGEKNLVSIPSLCEKLGYNVQWDKFTQRLSCTKNTSKIVFNQDNYFYSINGAIYQLELLPLRYGGSLYLPLTDAINALRPVHKGIFQWDSTSKTVSVNSKKYNIHSVVCEKKQNGTLLTLTLSDSLPFDCTYFYPNLTVNFLNGTVDTNAVRQGQRIGLVDSIFAIQYKQSAQVSAVLIREIEDPVIDYIQDKNTLMIALRPKKVKPQIAKIADEKQLPISVPVQNVDISSVKTIVIDPGHGGKDPGAVGSSGIQEKNVVLAISLKLNNLLKKQSKLKVYLTRDKDVFIPLSERTKFANEKKADLFVSIHANAIPGSNKRKDEIRGYKFYFLSQAKNEEDKLAAMRENAVIELEEKPQNYDNLHNVLIDLAGNEFLKESQDFCILLDQKFSSSIKKLDKLHLGIGQANFWVLNGAYMPSVLVETGFISNKTEEKLLSDEKFQAQMAKAIFDAIISFTEKYETNE
jgi:N-acetylmuramoyl-L-alanine amidase